MTFDMIEELARQKAKQPGTKTTERMSAADRFAFFCMTELYRKFYIRSISREAAQRMKARLKADYEELRQDRAQYAAAYSQYQENIRNASALWTGIVLFARTATDTELIDRLLQIITAMVGEDVTSNQVRKERNRRVSN